MLVGSFVLDTLTVMDEVSCGTVGDALESFFFFFNDTATTEIYTLSLHDALPIYIALVMMIMAIKMVMMMMVMMMVMMMMVMIMMVIDRKSTRLNSSHANISYAVFCLKKKNELGIQTRMRVTLWIFIDMLGY